MTLYNFTFDGNIAKFSQISLLPKYFQLINFVNISNRRNNLFFVIYNEWKDFETIWSQNTNKFIRS